MGKPMLYIIDDHQEQLTLLSRYVAKLGMTCQTFLSADECLNAIKNQPPDGIITDLFMPQMDGHTFLKKCQKQHGNIPTVVLTVSDSTADAVKAIRYGAWDFITKPLGFDRFKVTVENMLSRHALEKEMDSLLRQSEDQASFDDIIGQSQPMKTLFSAIRKVAPTQTPVLIEGASGVGKELVAKALHKASACQEGPFVSVNCGAIPENLVESTLFGYKKGAFTGAGADKDGKFQAAHGGTLFLDEVGDLPHDAQVKLLRALQEEEVEPVGATTPQPVNIRLICATHKNLSALVQEGRFREDLYYRIHVYPVHVPALKNRQEDIPILAETFVRRQARQNNLGKIKLSKGALSFLQSFPWPGNVRQLENAITRAVVNLGDKRAISADDFSWLTPEQHSCSPLIKDNISNVVSLREMEVYYIRQVLDLCGGNLTKAAEKLDIARGTLYRKLKYIPDAYVEL